VAESVEVLITASIVPGYAHPGDAGADLHSAEALVLAPGQRALVGTGVAIALPDGYAAFVVPRSGLAARHGITIVNSPGTVDAGYRGEIKVTLLNTDPAASFTVAPGDRIAQLIVMPVARAAFIPVERLPGSQRGTDGFGSTGLGRTPENQKPQERLDRVDNHDPARPSAGTPTSGETP
jgi:dUTP pyrophosphatase